MGRCKDRLCPLCSSIRGTQATHQLAGLIRKMDAPRFLTLTLAHSEQPLAAQVSRLYQCFKELRRNQCWKQHVHGGVYAFEVTRNQHKGSWHPHLHLVIDGDYFPHKMVKEAWLRVTGDSSIVHIEKVYSAYQQARYLAQYVAAPADVEKWQAEDLVEYAEALHGRRLLHTFGTLHNRKCDSDEEDKPIRGFNQLATVREVQELATEKNPHALRAIELMQRAGGWFAALTTKGLFSRLACPVPLEQWELMAICTEVELAVRPPPPVADAPAEAVRSTALFEFARPP
jgi:hypothetical protein